MSDPYQKSLNHFCEWLLDYSPYFAELRTKVFVHEDAPLRLAQLWETLGWSPGVGFGGLHEPLRPDRHVTRAVAERTFKAWTRASDGSKVWARLPARPWVFWVKTWERYGREPGIVRLIDEDAGDDPLLLETKGLRAASSGQRVTRTILRLTVHCHGRHRRVAPLGLRPARKASPFAPALEGFYELAPGVWGLSQKTIDGKRPAREEFDLFYRKGEDLIDYVVANSERLERLPGFQFEAQFLLEDLGFLQPEQLLPRGFCVIGRNGRPSAAGRLDGLPFIVHPHDDRRTGTVQVPMEYVKRFRELMKQQKLSAYQTLTTPKSPIVEPNAKHRGLVKKLWQQAQRTAPGAQRLARTPDTSAKRAPSGVPIEKEAQGLRELLLRCHPEFELEPVELTTQEPPSVRAFWSTLGWCRELGSIVGWPDRAASRHALREALEDYRSWESPLQRSALPKLFRVARVDDQGVGILLTDETKKADDDPPLLFASAETGKISLVTSSYLGWVIEELRGHLERQGLPPATTRAKKPARARKRPAK